MAINGIDNSVEKQSKSEIKSNNVFLQKFLDTKKVDWDFENDYLDSIFDSRIISWDLKKDLEDFKASESKFSLIDLEKLTISDLKIFLSWKYNTLNWKRKKAELAIISDYDISDSEYKNNVLPEIKKLNDRELSDFNFVIKAEEKDKVWAFDRRDKKISDFLKSIYKEKNIPKKKEKVDILTWIVDYISGLTYAEKKKLNKENDKILWELSSIDTSRGLNSTSDLSILSSILKLKNIPFGIKEKIVADYFPQVTLSEAKQFGLSTRAFNDEKEKIVSEYFSAEYIEANWIKKILKDINFNDDDVVINTVDLLVKSKNIKSIINNDLLNNSILSSYISRSNIELEKELLKESENIDNDLEWFKNKLSKLDKVTWSEKFRPWSYIIVKQKTSLDSSTGWRNSKVNKWEAIVYLKISGISDNTWLVTLSEKWVNTFYNWIPEKEDWKTFASILNFIENANPEAWIDWISSFEIINKDELDTKLLSGEIEKWRDVDFSDKLEWEKIISNLEWQKVDKIDELTKKYESEWKSISEINELIENDSEIIDLQEKLKKAENLDKDEIIKQISEVDSWFNSSKYDFDVWTTFTTKKANWNFYYTIASFDQSVPGWKLIVADAFWKSVELTFIEFINAFIDQNCRITSTSSKNMSDFSSMFALIRDDEDIKWKWAMSWWNFTFKDKWILRTNTNNEKDQTGIIYDYLVAESWEELIQIHSTSWNEVVVSFWEYKEETYDDDVESKWIKKGDVKNKSFWVDSKKYTITIWELYSRISNFKLRPRCLDEEKDVIEDKSDWPDIKWHFWSRFFKRMSIAEIMQWGKVWLDSIENYLKEWREENAAKFASWVLWKVLPTDLKNDLISRVESSQKKRQDESIQKLKDVDSWPATKMIIWWLRNKDVPEHKKEAWMIFMLEKYWVLYAKKLTKHKWSFLWYEAMWGKIWDKLYNDIKHQMEVVEGMPFTEEHLLFVLINKQCRWDLHPKRRSRVHKEYNRFRNQWKEEEAKTWEQDASNKRTVEWRVKYVFWEIEWGTYPNGRWWYSKVIEKWWPHDVLSEVPFVTMFSWVAYWFEQDELDQWKNCVIKWHLVWVTKFMWYLKDINLFNDTVLEVAKIIEKEWWGRHKWIYNAALEVFSNQKKVEWDKDKITRGQAFYKYYWSVLSNAMNMLNVSDTSADSQYSDLIVTHKDKVWDREWNWKLKEYYNRFHVWEEFMFDNEDLMTDSFYEAWTTWMDIKKATTDVLWLGNWATLRKKRSAPIVWREITNAFSAMATKHYDCEDDRKVKMKHELRWMIAWFIENNWWSEEYITSYNTPGFMFSRLNEWWVYLKDISENSISLADIESKTDKNAEILLDKWVNQIYDFEVHWVNLKKSVEKDVKFEIKDVEDKTKSTIADISSN